MPEGKPPFLPGLGQRLVDVGQDVADVLDAD
jgi:hypothetical protein